MQYAKNIDAKINGGWLFGVLDAYLWPMRFLLPIVVFLMISVVSCAQKEDGYEAYMRFWHQNDMEFRDPEMSPLTDTEIADFDSIPRFAFNPAYRVEARWVALERQKPFVIEATGNKRDTYQKVALLHFKIGDDSLTLAAYQNLSLMRNPDYRDYIFVPFGDETNAETTYGGGRYIDFSRPSTQTVILDFNQAYNPYCAYNPNYSCPIPPAENRLKVRIPAGARTDYNH